jgi:hypothetical protein
MRIQSWTVLSIIILLAVPLMVRAASAEIVERSGVFINIEEYEVNKIEFDKGDRVTISLQLTSYAYPVSVLLIKGDEDFDQFVESDKVDLEAIKEGKDVDLDNISYRVVGGFSARNVTDYHNSISLGQRDTYYVVIILYRNSNMSYQEILSTRATTVDYKLEYDIDEKVVPWYLLPIAAIIFIIGLSMVVYYVWRSRIADETVTPPPDDMGIPDRKPASEKRTGPPRAPPLAPR